MLRIFSNYVRDVQHRVDQTIDPLIIPTWMMLLLFVNTIFFVFEKIVGGIGLLNAIIGGITAPSFLCIVIYLLSGVNLRKKYWMVWLLMLVFWLPAAFNPGESQFFWSGLSLSIFIWVCFEKLSWGLF